MKSIDPDAVREHVRARFGFAAHPLLGAAALLFITGCSHRTEGPSLSAAGTPSLTGPVEVAVPLPTQTPFDRNPKLRAVFLESYARGYDLAATNTEYASPGCLCESDGDPEWYEATVEGFFAGKQAGSAAYVARQAKAKSTPAVLPK